MTAQERDPYTGHMTTGHEWNGIKELDTPVPKGVLIFLIVTHLFAFAWWILMPTWPLGDTYTKGILNTDQRTSVEKHLVDSQAGRADWMKRIESESLQLFISTGDERHLPAGFVVDEPAKVCAPVPKLEIPAFLKAA